MGFLFAQNQKKILRKDFAPNDSAAQAGQEKII